MMYMTWSSSHARNLNRQTTANKILKTDIKTAANDNLLAGDTGWKFAAASKPPPRLSFIGCWLLPIVKPLTD